MSFLEKFSAGVEGFMRGAEIGTGIGRELFVRPAMERRQEERTRRQEARQATQDVEADKSRIRAYFATDPAGALSQAQAKGYTELVTELEGRRSGQMQQTIAGIAPTPDLMAPMTSAEAGAAAGSLTDTIRGTMLAGSEAARMGLSSEAYTLGVTEQRFQQQSIQNIQEALRRLENTTKLNEDARAAITGDVVAAYVDAGFSAEDGQRALDRHFKVTEQQAFQDALQYLQAGIPVPADVYGNMSPGISQLVEKYISQDQQDETRVQEQQETNAVWNAYKYATVLPNTEAFARVWSAQIARLNLSPDSPAAMLAQELEPMGLKEVQLGASKTRIAEATMFSNMIKEHVDQVTRGVSPQQTTFGILHQSATNMPLSGMTPNAGEISAVQKYVQAEGQGREYSLDADPDLIFKVVEHIKKTFPAQEKVINEHLNNYFQRNPAIYAKLKAALEEQGFVIDETNGPKLGRTSTPSAAGFLFDVMTGQAKSTPRSERAIKQAASARAILEGNLGSFMPPPETVVQAGIRQEPQKTGNRMLQGGGR